MLPFTYAGTWSNGCDAALTRRSMKVQILPYPSGEGEADDATPVDMGTVRFGTHIPAA